MVVTNIVKNVVFKVILSQATMPKNKSLYNFDLIKMDSISREISCTSKISPLIFEVGSQKLEVRTQKSELKSQKSEVRIQKSEVPRQLS